MQDFQFLGANRTDEHTDAPETPTESMIPDDIREAMNAPENLDFSGDNFPAIM